MCSKGKLYEEYKALVGAGITVGVLSGRNITTTLKSSDCEWQLGLLCWGGLVMLQEWKISVRIGESCIRNLKD
jgi:hypothetical protein